ncbi:MAG: GntR family transcriptional regulator [Comamonadaceae bacterium]|nr:MAG: GntR family transcriptional regulator [Comamonadaceae bacterium]
MPTSKSKTSAKPSETPQWPGPRYAVVAAELMALISSGRYGVGSLMPTEHELSSQYQVSRQTVREAIRHLSDQGLVTRQPGVGTRVVLQSPATHHAYSINSMRELEGYADEARLRIADVSGVTVEGDSARLLDCSDGAAWLHIRGVRYRKSDEVPIGVTEIFLRDWFPGVERHLRSLTGAIHVMLAREYDVSVEEIRQDARAVLLGANDARALSAIPGSPGMEVIRRYYLADEKLMLMGRIVYAADRFTYSMRFRKSEKGKHLSR